MAQVQNVSYKTFYYRESTYGSSKPKFIVRFDVAGLEPEYQDILYAKCVVDKDGVMMEIYNTGKSVTANSGVEFEFDVPMWSGDTSFYDWLSGTARDFYFCVKTPTQDIACKTFISVDSSAHDYMDTSWQSVGIENGTIRYPFVFESLTMDKQQLEVGESTTIHFRPRQDFFGSLPTIAQADIYMGPNHRIIWNMPEYQFSKGVAQNLNFTFTPTTEDIGVWNLSVRMGGADDKTLYGGQNNENFITVTGVAPPPEWKYVDPPPADFPATFIPWLHLLDDALDANDAEGVKNVIRQYAWEHGSPIVFIAALALIGKAILGIVSILGSKAFGSFLFEETLQTIDMAIWEARSAEQWDLAQGAVNKKRELFETTWWEDVLSWVPGANVIMAVEKFKDASLYKLDLDQELLDRHRVEGGVPSTGAIGNYVDALDAGQDPTTFERPTESFIEVNVNVDDANVYFNGTWTGKSPKYVKYVPTGTYTILVTKEGYDPKSIDITLEDWQYAVLDFILVAETPPPPEECLVTITSDPSDAKIYIDGEYKFAETPHTFTLSWGPHLIELELEGYEKSSENYTVPETETDDYFKELEEVVIPPTECLVTITSDPTNANIYIDTEYKFVQTPHTFSLTYGDHLIGLVLEGHVTTEEMFTVPEKETETYFKEMEEEEPSPPPPTTGIISISVIPQDATIAVSGHPEITDQGDYELTAGNYSIQFSKIGYYTQTKTIYLGVGDTKVCSVILTEETQEPTQATLIILSTPTGAKVSIDGTYKFVVTPYTIKLDAGTYTIRTELEGFDAIEETITLSEGEERQYMALFEGDIPYYPPEEEVTVELTPVEYTYNCWKYKFVARDIVSGEEINAKIFIDAEDTTKWTPWYFYFNPETTYVVKFTRYGYHDAEVTINTAALPAPD